MQPDPPTRSVFAFEAPVRVWHWLNVLCLVVLAVTGFLIGDPPASVGGEASDSFLFGTIRFVHFVAAFVFTIAFLMRLYWALVGNQYAREIFYLPVWRASFWASVWHELRWYAFASKEPKLYVGHNPLARITMFLMVTVATLFMIVTGFALYAEGQGAESWYFSLFGWVFSVWPNSQDIHSWHHLGMWALITFAILHVYVVIREGLLSDQSTFSVMWSGFRFFKKGQPSEGSPADPAE